MHLDRIEQVGSAATAYQFAQCVLWNSARANLARTPNQNLLHRVADNFARNTAAPADRRLIEAATLPPFGIAAGGVHRRLESARERLAQLITSHQQTFASLRVVKLTLT